MATEVHHAGSPTEPNWSERWRLPPGVQTVSVWLTCPCRPMAQARPVHFTLAAVKRFHEVFGPEDIIGSYWCRKCKQPLAIRIGDLVEPGAGLRPR